MATFEKLVSIAIFVDWLATVLLFATEERNCETK